MAYTSPPLGVPYHQQDSENDCGAACVQMVLASMGKGLFDQRFLYSVNHSNTVIDIENNDWQSGPDGVATTLTMSDPGGKGFLPVQLCSEDQISRNIAWTIQQVKVPPIALVQEFDHWVVVTGFTSDKAPVGPDDNSYTISSFDLHDPLPYLYSPSKAKSTPEPPHLVGDRCAARSFLNVNVSIGIGDWHDDYMTGVKLGDYAGKYIAVCDPEPGSEREGMRFDIPTYEPVGDVATPEEAIEFAARALDDYGLSTRDGWAETVANTSAGTPLLVRRLDRPGSFYYLVPRVAHEPSRVLAVVCVDAGNGRYKQAARRDASAQGDFPAISPDSVVPLLKSLGLVPDSTDAEQLFPLVWGPCEQSRSPLLPFYEVILADGRFFVRIDGEVFEGLTQRALRG